MMSIATRLPFIGIVLFIALFILLPFMVAKGMCYRAMMTSLNGVRFGFSCSMKRFWLIIAGLPVATVIGLALCNHFMSRLSLADGRICFRSTLTYFGMLYRMCALVVVSGITGGLAYPLLKMWMFSWQAENMYVIGDLDALTLENTDQPADTGVLATVSRGIMPTLPFL